MTVLHVGAVIYSVPIFYARKYVSPRDKRETFMKSCRVLPLVKTGSENSNANTSLYALQCKEKYI